MIPRDGCFEISQPGWGFVRAAQRVWEEVSAHFPLRHAWIQELSTALAAVERDRQVVMRDTLAQLVAVLMQNAHVGPGVVERVVEKEAALVNHEMNDNKRSTAELVRRLSRREVGPWAGLERAIGPAAVQRAPVRQRVWRVSRCA